MKTRKAHLQFRNLHKKLLNEKKDMFFFLKR